MVIKQIVSKYLKLCDLVSNSITYIKFEFKKDDGGQEYIGVYIAENCGKKYNKIETSKYGLRVRTPLCLLKKYHGKLIILYKDYLSSDNTELFRIKPFDFSFDNIRKRPVFYRSPYFTKAGILVIPSMYISEYLDEFAGLVRASFTRMNKWILEDGDIHAILTPVHDPRPFNYPLYQCGTGLRTRVMYKFLDFAMSNNKKLENFKYYETYEDEYNKYGLIVFKEVILDG